MAGPGGKNGRTEARDDATIKTEAIRLQTDEVTQAGLLEVSSQLSRKLSWALSTSWESATGQKAPRGLVNDLASKYTVELVLALAGKLPLHLGLSPPSDGD